jgi:hypothetical protein
MMGQGITAQLLMDHSPNRAHVHTTQHLRSFVCIVGSGLQLLLHAKHRFYH